MKFLCNSLTYGFVETIARRWQRREFSLILRIGPNDQANTGTLMNIRTKNETIIHTDDIFLQHFHYS